MSLDERQYREAERRLWAFFEVTPTERRVTLKPDGISVRLQEFGSGPPVLFIHGGPNSGSTWAPLVAGLEGFRCLLLDRPGTGLSESLRLDITSLPAFADGLVPSVLDALSIDRAHVVASSIGGYLALRSAAAVPNRVERMVQLGCPAFVPDMSLPPVMRLMTVGTVRRLMDIPKPTPAIAKSMFKQIGHGASINAGLIPESIFDWYASLMRFTDTMHNEGAMIGRLGSVLGFSRSLTLTREILRAVAAPTLFIWGEDDSFGSRKLAERVSSELPNAQLMMLPRAGHLPWLDAPTLVTKAIADFLRPGSAEVSQVGSTAQRKTDSD